ncbi:MAG: Zn-ribbon domain-containing OB-fold protein [Candidatus Rokubacteria bacterium]|nr:Zn-ribbon domain-containing OB-fold protein [Candidatus Rokubacteria bacterium]
MSAELPTPVVTPETAPYWEGARAGKLLLQRCLACRALRFYPRRACPSCWSERVEWVEASGRGRVHSFTVIHRPPAPAFASRLPYVVALVDLEEGPRMMANVVGDGALEVAIDDPVTVTFEPRGDIALPQFQRVAR